MRFEDLPATAQAILTPIAKRFDLEPAELLIPRLRKPGAKTARRAAICALDDAKFPGGERRFSLDEISTWFSVSRNSIYVQRTKSPKFTPRRTPNPLTA